MAFLVRCPGRWDGDCGAVKRVDPEPHDEGGANVVCPRCAFPFAVAPSPTGPIVLIGVRWAPVKAVRWCLAA